MTAEPLPPPLVLIVDDDITVTTAIGRIVARLGHRAVTCNDPFEALELIEREPIDLVVTDKDMPQMSGHMLLDILKEGHPDVPCVLLTGVPSLESAMIAINSDQVIRYLTKPWTAQELEETIGVGLDRRAMLVDAAAARQAERERAATLEQVHARDAELHQAARGELVLAPTYISDSVDDAVRRHVEGDAAAALTAAGLADALTRARPAHVAEALAIVPLRNPTVGVLLSSSATASRVEIDVRGQSVTLVELPHELVDLVAVRLAVHAGIDPSATTDRLGRFTVSIPGASGQLVACYRRTMAETALELRRVLVGRDAAAHAPGSPQQVGPYRVLEKIGRGGMGDVYRAIHNLLDRPAALKVLNGAYADDPISAARFMREARAATRARHPRIVETFDFGHLPDGRPYLVMELVEGPTLQQRLRRGPFEQLEAVLVARDIAEGLAAAHRVDVIHRDLKPANIFVDERLVTKLCDFGAAKILEGDGEDLTRAGVTLGTPSYMSPEHITGKTLDGRTDLYALGCVLYEMLSGEVPYKGDMRTVLAQHLTADVPTVTATQPLQPSLVKLVKKAMAKDRRQRYLDIEQMIGDLDFIAEELSRARGARRS